jgi:predicted transposase YdaD
VEVIDTDVSTVSAAADKALLIRDPEPWVLHVELQSSWDGTMPRRLHHYNAFLEYRWEVAVHSLVILLRREADSPQMDGTYQRAFGTETPYRYFRYQVVRLWQLPLKVLLEGGLGLLPLAPLTDEAEPQLPAVIRRMQERITGGSSGDEAANLWTATDVLLGLRYSRDFIDQLLQGVGTMEDSVTYQAIVEKGYRRGLEKGRDEGRLEGLSKGAHSLREAVTHLGTQRFGPPDPQTITALEAITDVDTLTQLAEKILEAKSWQELLKSDANVSPAG